MEEACEYVERIVNAELRKRERYPLEWGGEPDLLARGGEPVPLDEHGDSASNGEGGEKRKEDEKVIWRANVAASNRYEGGSESVGFHSDQLTYLGPYPTIASLSLGELLLILLSLALADD